MTSRGSRRLGNVRWRLRVVDQPPRQVAFAHAGAGPVDDLRRQHAANAQLLAKAQQQHIDRRRVGIGQLGQVADAHHHFGVGIAAADFQIAAQAGGKAEADRLENRIDRAAARSCSARNSIVSSSPASVAGSSGTTTTSQPQSAAASRLLLLTDSTSSAPAAHGQLDLAHVHAVDRNAMARRRPAPPPPRPRPLQGSPGSQPTSIRSAPSARSRVGLGQDLVRATAAGRD